MRNIWTIAKREYNAYYNSPLAYVVMTVLFLWIGAIFTIDLIAITNSPFFTQALQPERYLGSLIVIILLSSPVLTMRLISEESIRLRRTPVRPRPLYHRVPDSGV